MQTHEVQNGSVGFMATLFHFSFQSDSLYVEFSYRNKENYTGRTKKYEWNR